MPKIQKRKIFPKGILKEWPPMHCYSDGKGGLWTHEGTGAECARPECVALREPEPWGYSDEHVESWTLGREPDPSGPCPLTGLKHRWQYGDDGIGHSGDVCACGAFRE